MADSGKSRALARLALWHLLMAIDLLKRLYRPFASELSAISGGKSLPIAVEKTLAPVELATAENPSLDVLKRLWQQQRIEEIRKMEYFTNDIVEVRGRLGKEDNRQLRINGQPPVKLDRREHTVLLILAYFGRYISDPARASKKHLPAFMPVSAIVGIIDKLTAGGGPLAGLWPYPVDLDVHRCIGSLREVLLESGWNRKLIESGQRGAGYRVSTLASNLFLDEGQEDWEAFWAALFDAVL